MQYVVVAVEGCGQLCRLDTFGTSRLAHKTHSAGQSRTQRAVLLFSGVTMYDICKLRFATVIDAFTQQVSP
jgi:hypothetical protein